MNTSKTYLSFPKLYSRYIENDSIIYLLQNYRNYTNDVNKKKEYTHAIIEVLCLTYIIDNNNVCNLDINENIKQVIKNQLLNNSNNILLHK
jgi:hypothetical protein